MEATSVERNVTKNVVYREVLLHRRQPPPPQVPVSNTPAISLGHDHSSSLDYHGIYDNRQEHAQSVSVTLPSNVTLAPLPTAREAEVFPIAKKQLKLCQQAAADMESEQAAHEAWLASLISPPEAPMTADEAERAEMLNRRRQFMATLMDRPLTEEIFTAAKAADIFIG